MKAEVLSEDDLKILKKVADQYVEEMHAHPIPSHDPFEMYADALKIKFFGHPAAFSNRFIQGYQSLMQEIEKNLQTGKPKSR